MNNLNKQALIKLATVRLAINHVLRQRMNKQAEVLYDPKEDPRYGTPEFHLVENPLSISGWTPQYFYYPVESLDLDDIWSPEDNAETQEKLELKPYQPDEYIRKDDEEKIKNYENYRSFLQKVYNKYVANPTFRGSIPNVDYPDESAYLPRYRSVSNAAEDAYGRKMYEQVKQTLYPQSRARMHQNNYAYKLLQALPGEMADKLRDRRKELEAEYAMTVNVLQNALGGANNFTEEDLKKNPGAWEAYQKIKALDEELAYVKASYDEIFSKDRREAENTVKDNYRQDQYQIEDWNRGNYGTLEDRFAAGQAATDKYREQQRDVYKKDLELYRQIYNKQHGYAPDTPLTKSITYINPNQKGYAYSPVTGKMRKYTYDVINNPHHEYDSSGFYRWDPLHIGGYLQDHIPSMKEQWKNQDAFDRGVQSFNQTLDKAVPQVNKLLNGKLKSFIEPFEKFRQGFKSKHPEWWSRPAKPGDMSYKDFTEY